MNLQRKFGFVLKELRLKKGLSQESLANQANIDRTYISDIEKGERNISLKIIERISESLQISLSELFKKIEKYGELK
ncbi:helix-turn-helix transcriptional regulator [Flavobacteriales bacterium]|nr:helix-turn-helix transcriptional regulator [Flavobacteriales bacterium]|tara:strand:+ start:173 stop:403 length:231 start_codon:yes stop_codon:yes gene_type:complete